MAKQWMLAKKNEDVIHGVYLRDIPLIVANVIKNECCEWWAEHEERILCIAIGAMATASAFVLWKLT